MHERWIDIGKSFAIIAVLTDHLYRILYSRRSIQYFSWFAVSLFILLMGVTTYWTFDKKNETIWNKVKKKIIKILIPYTGAVFVYIWVTTKGFDLMSFFYYWIHFNVTGPHYYVFLYCQLILISPLFFVFLKNVDRNLNSAVKTSSIICGGGVVILFISSVFTNRTAMADIYGGGGKLAGGTYIICLYVGMIFGKYYNKIIAWLNKYIICVGFIFSLAITILSWRLLCIKGFIFDSYGILGEGINPPGWHLLVYSLSVMMTIFFGEKLFGSLGIIEWIMKGFEFIGRHTLYIFLYHKLFLGVLGGIINHINISNKIMEVIFYYFPMIGGSLIIEVICKKARNYITNSYKYSG